MADSGSDENPPLCSQTAVFCLCPPLVEKGHGAHGGLFHKGADPIPEPRPSRHDSNPRPPCLLTSGDNKLILVAPWWQGCALGFIKLNLPLELPP